MFLLIDSLVGEERPELSDHWVAWAKLDELFLDLVRSNEVLRLQPE